MVGDDDKKNFLLYLDSKGKKIVKYGCFLNGFLKDYIECYLLFFIWVEIKLIF